MIDGNWIKFGYGSVAVGCDPLTRIVKFQQIKPPCECGSAINDNKDVEYIGQVVKIYFDISSYNYFMKKLSDIEAQKISVFQFDDYWFDFSNYNIESINVCRKCVKGAIYLEILAMAC